jgi:hypothetical protein
MARSRPAPCKLRVQEPSTWTRGLNRQSSLSPGINDARVGYREQQIKCILLAGDQRSHFQLDAAPFGELQGIAHQVEQNLPDPRMGKMFVYPSPSSDCLRRVISVLMPFCWIMLPWSSKTAWALVETQLIVPSLRLNLVS